jgi:hypothetical protein
MEMLLGGLAFGVFLLAHIAAVAAVQAEQRAEDAH